ncbi:MAG: electron transport complex subunit RsxA [Candidatus Omnitrophica bacterium]|nr:electron transport complex subunit RsxA [Candidatus Omnitrophota bacterium]MCM8826008.1 electron transport complex subunit RsxA [Candidatus Omnitrophota bacterium]
MKDIVTIFISAILINNLVLYYFLGICPFLGVSAKIESALGMGMAVIFVMTLANTISWLIYHLVLIKLGITFLTYIVFILSIASLVQIVEMVVKRFSPSLYKSLGIFLPLITVNCAILGSTLFMIAKDYNFIEAVVYGFSGGLGFTLIIVIMASLREDLDYADVPSIFKGAAITLITTGLFALVFMGFSGLISA